MLTEPKEVNMIRTTWRSGMWIGSTLLNSKLYRAAKRKGVWYYRLFISDDFAKTMGDIYDLNVMERKLKGLSKLKKRVFNVDDDGNRIDIDGNLLDEDGNYIPQLTYTADNGRAVKLKTEDATEPAEKVEEDESES